MVGPEAGQFNGGLAHRGDQVCPHHCTGSLQCVLAQACVEGVVTGQWKYTDGRSWQVDTELRVVCLDKPEPEPECVYSDQTEFQVLNLLL